MSKNKFLDCTHLLKEKYGEKGTPPRDRFDSDSLAFRLGVMLKEARKEANLTQEELAKRTGTKKAISRELNKDRAIFSFQHITN